MAESNHDIHSNIQELVRYIQRLERTINNLSTYIKTYTDQKGYEAIPRGDINIRKYKNYYDVNKTITKATPNNPNDFDSPSYQRERIFVDLQRYAEKLMVTNDGPGTLFIIVSHEGETNFSQEAEIFSGDTKWYYNVYEIRVRSPTIGLHYRVTEYEINSGSSTGFAPAEVANLQNVNLPASNTNWLSSNIIPIMVPTTFRIQVAVSISGTLSSVITSGGNVQIMTLNPAGFNASPGQTLSAGTLYMFNLLVHSGDTVNFQYSTTGGIIQNLRVQEIDSAIST